MIIKTHMSLLNNPHREARDKTNNDIETSTTRDMLKSTETITDYFPHLPAYSEPTAGILSTIPRPWVPYAQLMRIDRPGGLYAFYFPYLIGISYGACITSPTPEPSSLLSLAAVLLPFSVVLRGAACTWNDTVDQDFDRQVARCRHRPVARGAVSTSRAHLFTAWQLALLYPTALLCFPAACLPHLHVTVLLFGVYALMKRVTYYPQAVLGIPFAWAVFFCAAALDVKPHQPVFHVLYSPLGYAGEDHHAVFLDGTDMATLAMFAANVLWTVTYDTIYAHQDVADDAKAGVKGMALKFRRSTKLLSSVLSIGQVGFLASCGVWAGFGTFYFLFTVGGVGLALAYYIYDVDLESPESCGAWFHDQFWIVGAPFLTGLIGEYLTVRRIPNRF